CVYVSHRMGEIFACCDRVSVLRDGRYVATGQIGQVDEPKLVSWMIGRTLSPHTKERAAIRELAGGGHHAALGPSGPTAAAALQVTGIGSPGRLEKISLAVRPGEILGVGGL